MIVVLGGSGQLGRQLLHDYPDLVGLDYPRLDFTKPETFDQIAQHKPTTIINCAAYTNVDGAESEKELAHQINAVAPGILAKLAKDLNAVFVHISTDSVFDGTAKVPYKETDKPGPINQYGRTKLAGERAVQESGAEHLVIRTAWLNGNTGPNFVLRMLELGRKLPAMKAVTDQTGSPTFTKDLSRGIMALINSKSRGLFHCVNDGQASRYEFVKEIFRLSGITIPLSEATTDEFPAPARRQNFSALSIEKIKPIYQPRTWQEGLKDYLEELGAKASTVD